MTAVLDELALTDLVTSIPGISAIGAAAILAQSGDPRRFVTARALVKHAGLAPRAVGIHSEGHSSAPLTAMEQRFLFSVLAGATTWTTTGQELVIRQATVGSARFAEATER